VGGAMRGTLYLNAPRFAQRIDYRCAAAFARKINLAKNDNFVMMRGTYE
jgi:hypothetical protein